MIELHDVLLALILLVNLKIMLQDKQALRRVRWAWSRLKEAI